MNSVNALTEYELKYKIASDLIKKGYIIHCTNNIFDTFDESKISGWPRAKEGYGFYFSDMPYKPIEYGNIMKIVKKDDFRFLNSQDQINMDMFNYSFNVHIKRLSYMLDDVRNNREYDMITNEIEELEKQNDKIGGDELFDVVLKTIKQYNIKTYGQLEYNIVNPQKWIPKLIKLYMYYGYDGYETDGIYTIFNFDKLNSLVKTVDIEKYNINESLDISSFEINDSLNPEFWKNDKLDSRIRLKLLDIADDFTDFLNVDWVKPDDIIMTGSLANYNWSVEHSDIDLHIVIDFKKVDDRIDFVKDYFDSKKKIWNQEHEGIKILGFPVELYVQDKNEPHASSGIYSIEQNKWIKKPEKTKLSTSNLKKAEKNAEKWADKIDKLIDRYYPDAIESEKERILNGLDYTFNDIKNSRRNGFSKNSNEMNKDNLTFKILRRNGYLDKIHSKKNEIYNDLMSINEGFSGSRVVKNKKLYSLLKREGLEGILLLKGYGYFYIDSDVPEMQRIIDTLSETSIYLNSFSDQPVEMWVEDIKDLLKNGIANEIESSQKPKEFRLKLNRIS